MYLNDSAEAAAAVRAFARTLESAGPTIQIAEAQGLAPELEDGAVRTCALWRRLAAERLEDSRLEAQRRAVVGPLGRACTLMTQTARLASRGDVREMAQQAKGVVAALDDVRAAVRTGS